jgi:hypothetical protein
MELLQLNLTLKIDFLMASSLLLKLEPLFWIECMTPGIWEIRKSGGRLGEGDCTEARNWGEELLYKKWLLINYKSSNSVEPSPS